MQVWLNVMELAERVKIAKQLVKMLCKANVILLAIFTVFHVALMHQKTLSSTYTSGNLFFVSTNSTILITCMHTCWTTR